MRRAVESHSHHSELRSQARSMSKSEIVKPRTLKGFRDFLPAQMMQREAIIDKARRVYRSYGFAPIDTPVLELFEILNGKGGEESDRLMYRFTDNGGREVGMRFDLTVPLARYVAQHANDLGMPFKRYHIAKVWRGENTHRGRYREFMQCDFDTIGTTSSASDIEMLLVINDLMTAIGLERFTMRVNHRQVLNGLLEKMELLDKSADVLRSIDKLAKIGREKVIAEMVDNGVASTQKATEILKIADLAGSSGEVLDAADALVTGNERGEAGVTRLREIVAGVSAAGVPEERLNIDVSIARGLDYYTGTIVETFLNDLPAIGSVCSGGRYDNLAGVYTKQELPGIGASLGLDRLLAAMDELSLATSSSAAAPVLMTFFDGQKLHEYLSLAGKLRAAGVGVEVYPDPKKIGQQLKFANRRGFRIAIVAGEQEFERGVCQVKDLESGDAVDVALANDAADVITAVQKILKS